MLALLLAVALAEAGAVLELPGIDGRVTHAAWQPAGKVEHWIVSLHGTGGSAKRDIGVWQKNLAGRGIGVLAIQWWIGGDDYLTPLEIDIEIEAAVSRLGIDPSRALLHGFSRGSANLYAVAAIGARRKPFSLYVASSGGVALDYPPTRQILEGRFGAHPLAGTRWVTACGELDPNPERDGCPGMRRTGRWLKEQGALVVAAIEDPQSGHGALQREPRNAARLFELFLR